MKKLNFLKLSVMALAVCAFVLGCAAKKQDTSLNDMKELLKSHALVVYYQDGSVKTYDDNGIKPLFRHLETGDFKGTYVFDKVTGKASSLVLAYGGASKLYTRILSREAIPVLEKYKIEYEAEEIADYIVNRAGDDKCPMEKTVTEIEDPQEAFTVLKERFDK
jgi:hypothetical protein